MSAYLAEFVARMINTFLVKGIYRLKVLGAENILADDGAVLICNHVSYADASLIDASFSRPVRFIMDRDFYNIPWLKPICKLGRTIPISAKDTPKKIADNRDRIVTKPPAAKQ